MLSATTFSKPKMFCNKPRTLLMFALDELSICSFNLMCQTTSKHLEANFKNLLGIKLVTDVIFLVLWSENNDWTIYVFATGVDCKIRSAGSAEFKNVPYLSCRATCTINVSVKETSTLWLKIWMLSFLKESKYIS